MENPCFQAQQAGTYLIQSERYTTFKSTIAFSYCFSPDICELVIGNVILLWAAAAPVTKPKSFTFEVHLLGEAIIEGKRLEPKENKENNSESYKICT